MAKQKLPSQGIGFYTALLVALLLISGCTPETPAAQSDEPVRLTLLHTNDNHGRFWPNQYGEYGMAARKTLIDRIRAEVEADGGYTLLLSGGDVNTGVPESDMQDAEPDFRGMSRMGYDAMAVGNHEFDNPLEVIRKQQTWSSFDFLSANIYDGSGERLFKPYRIFNKGGVRIAVVGLITESTRFIGNPEYVEGLEFVLPEKEMATLLPELKRQAEVVIALTHMGHEMQSIGTDVALAKAVDGIDLIVGGHSQQPVCTDSEGALLADYQPGAPCKPDFENGTWIMQAHEWGKYVGRADLVIEKDSVQLVDYQLIPVNLKTGRDEHAEMVQASIPPDAELQAFLQDFQDKGGEALRQVITRAEATFDRRDKRRPSNVSPLGSLITQAFRQFSRADIAITNSGGIRDNLYEGDVTVKSLMQVMPFANTVGYVDLNGEELQQYFEAIGLSGGNQRGVQFSGMSFTTDGDIVVGDENQPLDPAKIYRLATNSFLAAGGDGYPSLLDKPTYVNSGVVDFTTVQQLLAGKESISPAQF
ncbi:bifunctional UDP-sugar hydrolase/5'-nucleotidase [Microbulbifer sp. SH-1]|uniref:bifunctional UDP-sugar hydrolase/5'-nucleotidase UshA n=1 Tax=Microbulbifer sp. SH-1 TaxID=2681547 RepID=UPI001409EBE1|nr:bifunctional UDP-sugar hydrolase/5'-nucleotidase UshA [Microbulbifer sp. SH-1]QIL88475.1 bifunctional UDP-sugar hydrolase/5'-nucleotidase [Microbulbifer sp. SH-1]